MSKLLHDEINKFIISNFTLSPNELSQKIFQEKNIDITYEAVRKRKARLSKNFGEDLSNLPDDAFTQSLKLNNFSGDWSHGWLKTEETSVFIRNEKEQIPFEKIVEENIEKMKKYSPKYPKVKREKLTDPHCLTIDIADLHIGKHSAIEETGTEYNSEIAIKRAKDGLQGLLNYATVPFDKVVFVIGNDIMHYDNARQTTTSGTHVGGEAHWSRMFNQACETTVTLIETALTVAPVHIVYCPSNHDYVLGYALAQYVGVWFRNCKDVTIDNSIEHQKFFLYGKNMMMFDHGDGHKEIHAPYIMATKRPVMWAEAIHRYNYKHHLHHKQQIKWQTGKDHTGVTVEFLRSPSPPDSWHDRNGYINSQAVEAFIHHPENGQVMRITHWF